jgi:hypothetical protein
VRFDGGEKFILTNCNTGAAYLHFMLGRRNTVTPVAEIMHSVIGESEDCVSFDCIDTNEFENALLFYGVPLTGADNIADETAIRQYRKEAILISEELEKAKKNGNTPMAEQLRQELDSITSAIYEAVAPDGQRKKLADQTKRIADAFRKAVVFAVEKISVHDELFASHLRDTIKYGYNPGYFPDYTVYWDL